MDRSRVDDRVVPGRHLSGTRPGTGALGEKRDAVFRRARRRYLEEIAAADIRTTCSIPVHANVDADWGIFDFAADPRPGGMEVFRKEFGAGIYPAAIAAFRRLRTQIDTRRGGRAPLAPNERECLLWLARGLRNDRIAERIGLKPVTVGLRISNTCRKLRAPEPRHW